MVRDCLERDRQPCLCFSEFVEFGTRFSGPWAPWSSRSGSPRAAPCGSWWPRRKMTQAQASPFKQGGTNLHLFLKETRRCKARPGLDGSRGRRRGSPNSAHGGLSPPLLSSLSPRIGPSNLVGSIDSGTLWGPGEQGTDFWVEPQGGHIAEEDQQDRPRRCFVISGLQPRKARARVWIPRGLRSLSH